MTIMMPRANSYTSMNLESAMEAGMMPAAMDIGEAMGEAQLSNANTQLAMTNMQNERIQAKIKRNKQRDKEEETKARMANINMALNDPDVDDVSKTKLRQVKADLYGELCGIEINTK